MTHKPTVQPKHANPAQPQPGETPPHKRHKLRALVGQLNITSMIDVVFLLLIYFVITVNFVVDEGVIMTDLPQFSTEHRVMPPITIGVRSGYGENSCVITYNDAVLPSFTALRARLEQEQDNPAKGRTGIYGTDYTVKIAPSQFVRWQYTLNAFNAALRAGYTNVSFDALPGNG